MKPLSPIQTVASDERGRMVVNGKPFFPILMYDVPTDAASLKKFHAHGFNAVTATKMEDVPALREHGLYAAIHAGHKTDKLDAVLRRLGGGEVPVESSRVNLVLKPFETLALQR